MTGRNRRFAVLLIAIAVVAAGFPLLLSSIGGQQQIPSYSFAPSELNFTVNVPIETTVETDSHPRTEDFPIARFQLPSKSYVNIYLYKKDAYDDVNSIAQEDRASAAYSIWGNGKKGVVTKRRISGIEGRDFTYHGGYESDGDRVRYFEYAYVIKDGQLWKFQLLTVENPDQATIDAAHQELKLMLDTFQITAQMPVM